MRLNSLVQPCYFPETDQQSVLRMGLHPLSFESWIQSDDDFPTFYQHKLQQRELRYSEVFGQTDEADDYVTEFNSFLLANLVKHQSNRYELSNKMLRHNPTGIQLNIATDSLWDSSLWIQEDVCLLKQYDQMHVLVAASLCSPSNWNLQEKLGRSVDEIHDPVPGYNNALSGKVEKFLSALKVNKPVYRFNWSVQQGNELYWNSKSELEFAETDLYWRVERQTLLRLPDTGAIVFSIRIYLHDFNTMAQHGQFESILHDSICRQQPEMRAYKGLNNSLLERLQRK